MKKWLTLFSKRYEVVILALLIIYFLIISTINSSFFTLNTAVRIAYNASQLILVTLGVSIVILTRNIDVSVGSLVGLAATLGGAAINTTMSTPMLLFVTLGTGLLGGLINGIGVAYLGVSSIIMTLGTMAIFRGLLIMYTGGKWIQTIPTFYVQSSRTAILGLPLPIWISVVVLIVLYYVFTKVRFGRLFYAVGNSAEGATLQGMPVRRILVMAYAICGLLAGGAAAIYIGQLGAVPNTVGVGLETQAIAAAVIGGVSLSGGKGTVIGAFIGALLMQTVNYSLVFLKVPGYWNDAISGFMLLAIIVFSALFSKFVQQQKEGSRQAEAEVGVAASARLGEGVQK